METSASLIRRSTSEGNEYSSDMESAPPRDYRNEGHTPQSRCSRIPCEPAAVQKGTCPSSAGGHTLTALCTLIAHLCTPLHRRIPLSAAPAVLGAGATQRGACRTRGSVLFGAEHHRF